MWQEDLASELASSKPSERRQILSHYQKMSGRTKQSLYRIAACYGFDAERRSRADRDKSKSELTPEQVEFVAALIYETRREVKGPIMPVARAIQIAEDSGIIQPGQVAPSTMNGLLRRRQISKTHQKAEPPHTSMRSLHPNHVHVFDASVCIQYYLKSGGLAVIDEREFYKNKPDNFKKIKERILRYVITDHFSGTFYFRYYNTTGETQANLWDFLKEAWTGIGSEKFPFRGVPFELLMDTGAANKAKAMTTFLNRGLDVKTPEGMPYNARRQGSAESTHNIIEEWFESGLRIQPATCEDEMNVWARDFMIWYNATQNHTRHGLPRIQCWLLIQEGQLREIPEERILQDLWANPEEERTVSGDCTISFQGKDYNLKYIPGLFRGAKVMVIKKPFRLPRIDVSYNEQIYEASPVEMLPAELGGFRADAAIIGQEYKSPPETLTQQAIKRFDNMAYGEDPLTVRQAHGSGRTAHKNQVPFAGLKVFGHQADKVGNLSFIEKRGTPIEVDHAIAETQISFTEFLKRLIQRVGPISKEMNQELRGKYGEAISVEEAERVINDAETRLHQDFGAAGGDTEKKAIGNGQ
jgi:hypothetical protein